jgi:hypothetical protein
MGIWGRRLVVVALGSICIWGESLLFLVLPLLSLLVVRSLGTLRGVVRRLTRLQ